MKIATGLLLCAVAGGTMAIDCSAITFIDSMGLRALIEAQRKANEVGARFRLAAVPGPVARVLDLACGHGRLANRLAARGAQVTGLDVTERFMEVARADAFAARAAEMGIGDGDVIVTYDDYYGIFASRVAWSFRFYGAEARVLDGGWRTWVDEDRPTTAAAREPRPADFTARVRPQLRRTVDEVEAARDRGATLVDARPRHLFLGESGAAGIGHIPGAVSLPYQELVDGATGIFATPVAIARLLRDAGLDPERPPRELIATCGTGVSATVALIALELAGVHGAGVYDGAFSEWSADPNRPIAYGGAG